MIYTVFKVIFYMINIISKPWQLTLYTGDRWFRFYHSLFTADINKVSYRSRALLRQSNQRRACNTDAPEDRAWVNKDKSWSL